MDRVLTAVLVVVLSSVLSNCVHSTPRPSDTYHLASDKLQHVVLALDVYVMCEYLAPRSTSTIVSVHLEARVQLQSSTGAKRTTVGCERSRARGMHKLAATDMVPVA